jgi:hypothetical protein
MDEEVDSGDVAIVLGEALRWGPIFVSPFNFTYKRRKKPVKTEKKR